MYLVFDIGGTHMRVAYAKDGTTFGKPLVGPTPASFAAGMKQLTELGRRAANGGVIRGIAGGIAGPLDKKKTALVNSPNLAGWVGKPFKKTLKRTFGASVFLENDTAFVGLGEAVAGAGKGMRIVAYVTVSTGVNGVKIVDGRIDENAFGFEIGHQVVASGDERCPSCNAPGHLESYISGAAMRKRYGTPPREITDEAVWEEAARMLAIGLNNTIVHWSPEVVILGGSMMKHPGIPLPRVKAHVQNMLTIFPKLPAIVPAALKDHGGLYGALAFLKQRMIE